jgi:hypothetical protein
MSPEFGGTLRHGHVPLSPSAASPTSTTELQCVFPTVVAPTDEAAIAAAVEARRPRGGVEEQKDDTVIIVPTVPSALSPSAVAASTSVLQQYPTHRKRQSPGSRAPSSPPSTTPDCNSIANSLNTFAKVVLGSCGVCDSACSGSQQYNYYNYGPENQVRQPVHPRPPLSIAEEIRKMNQGGASHPGSGCRSGSRKSGPGSGGAGKFHTSGPAAMGAGNYPLTPQQQYQQMMMIDPMTGRPLANDVPKFLGEEAVQSFEDDDNVSALSAHTLEELVHQRQTGNSHESRADKAEHSKIALRKRLFQQQAQLEELRRRQEMPRQVPPATESGDVFLMSGDAEEPRVGSEIRTTVDTRDSVEEKQGNSRSRQREHHGVTSPVTLSAPSLSTRSISLSNSSTTSSFSALPARESMDVTFGETPAPLTATEECRAKLL